MRETGADPAGATPSSSSSSPADPENGSDPYAEDNPYPGYEEYYDETHYEDGSLRETAEAETPAAAAPAEPAKPPSTDEELRAVKITVTTDARQKGPKA